MTHGDPSIDPTGTLHLVAVPIGNPADISLRALEVLRSVSIVAAEDTRHFTTLARHHGIDAPTLSYHDHNEQARVPQLLARLAAGEDVALVSDAGTPLVSDPGYRLVRAVIDAGIGLTVVPGPSAVATALAGSGLPPHPYRFLGFLPRTAAARRAALERVATDEATLIAFEAPRRLADALRDVHAVLGDRPACLARNLTKAHERWQRGPLSELIAELEAEGDVRGECTIVVGGAEAGAATAADAEADARLLMEGGAPARAVQDLLTRRYGLAKRDAYALVLRLRDGAS
ncbi:MAG TPA: 16S rRNA (cytidine(1402)-2'-O)-methyltransferase [Candidatus Limnocylindria bacterium]|nr:16S rRNA (cytidine(1402)-2'-O)-methyltransferase [Candidatus Limnocylindria bacterium]